MYCQKCGNPVEGTPRLCPRCGAVLPVIAPGETGLRLRVGRSTLTAEDFKEEEKKKEQGITEPAASENPQQPSDIPSAPTAPQEPAAVPPVSGGEVPPRLYQPVLPTEVPSVSGEKSAKKKNILIIAVLAAAAVLLCLVLILLKNGAFSSDRSGVEADSSESESDLSTAFPLPDMLGKEEETALAVLEAKDLKASLQRAYDPEVEEGRVISQNPEPNTLVNPGDTVTVVISLGPEAESGPIEFTDARIETAVRIALARGVGDILPSDLESIRSLVIDGGTVTASLSSDNVSLPESADSGSLDSLEDLALFTGLEKLYILGQNVTDLSFAEGMTGLKLLAVMGGSFSDLTSLGELSELETLVLRTAGENVRLEPLIGLTGLKKLDLSGTTLSDLTAIGSLSNLETLGLDNCGVASLTPLCGLTGLKQLSLSGNGISDLSALANLTSLTYLDLSDNPLSGLRSLEGMHLLTQLYLGNCGLTTLEGLATLSSLEVLDLSDNSFTDLHPLSHLTELRRLYLDHMSFTESALSSLYSCEKLEYLSILGARRPGFLGDGLDGFRENMPDCELVTK